eukprot:11744722-Heterocapsa_arctica.AAC.1
MASNAPSARWATASLGCPARRSPPKSMSSGTPEALGDGNAATIMVARDIDAATRCPSARA